MATPVRREGPILARDDERPRIERIEHLYEQEQPQSPGHLRIVGSNGEDIEIPESLGTVLRQAVQHLSRGDAVAVVPVQTELTTQQAADLLNISRQYLVRVLDRGEIPFHMVGTHRRLRFDDVMEYKRRRDAERRQGLDELTQLSQEIGLYDAQR